MGRWWVTLAMAVGLSAGWGVSIYRNGIDGWTVFGAFIVGALVTQSFYSRLIDGYRAILEGMAEGRFEIVIEEIREGEDEIPMDRPQGHCECSGD